MSGSLIKDFFFKETSYELKNGSEQESPLGLRHFPILFTAPSEVPQVSLVSPNTALGAHRTMGVFPVAISLMSVPDGSLVLSLWAARPQSCASAWLAAGKGLIQLSTPAVGHREKLQPGLSHCSHGMGSLSRDRPPEGHSDTAQCHLSPSTHCMCCLGHWNCCWAIGWSSEKSKYRSFCRRLFARVRPKRGKKNRPNNPAKWLHMKPLPAHWCRLEGTSVHLESSWIWLWFSNNQLWV